MSANTFFPTNFFMLLVIKAAGKHLALMAHSSHSRELEPDIAQLAVKRVIDAGSVIGADGFGWATLKKNHIKIPQFGNVVIEDDVWIGSQSVILPGTFLKKGCVVSVSYTHLTLPTILLV